MTKVAEAQARTVGLPMEGLMDAAERLLIAEGHQAISTRRVAEEAGLNHGLVHYYFGSMDELLAQVLERFTSRLIERQREMYAHDIPFIEKWRTAMDYLDADEKSGYQKLWFELQALSWNRPELRERVASVNAEWRKVVTEAFTVAARDYGIASDGFPVAAIVSLVMTFNQGLILEGLCGVREGRNELLGAIDRWLMTLEGRRR